MCLPTCPQHWMTVNLQDKAVLVSVLCQTVLTAGWLGQSGSFILILSHVFSLIGNIDISLGVWGYDLK